LAVLSLFSLAEDLEDVFLEEFRVGVAHVDEFEGVFHGYLVPAAKVIHEELDQIEEVPGFEARLVEDAALVHEGELILVDLSVEVFVNFPDPLVDFWLAVGEAEFGEDADEVLLVDGQSASLRKYGFLL